MTDKFSVNAFFDDLLECGENPITMIDLLTRAHALKRQNKEIGLIKCNGVFAAIERAVRSAMLRNAFMTINYATKRIDIMLDLLNCFIAFTNMSEHSAIPIPKQDTINAVKVLLECYETFRLVDDIVRDEPHNVHHRP